MNDNTSSSSLYSSAHDDEPLVILESESFAAFDAWMDMHLSQLVDSWIHCAAPNARYAEFRSAKRHGA